MEGNHGEVIRRIDAWIYVQQKPPVTVNKSLFKCWVCWHPRVACSKQRPRRINIVRLVQLPFDIWQAHHYSQVLPDVCLCEFESLAYKCWRSNLSPRHFCLEGFLSFETIEILGEAPTMCFEKVTLDYEHKQGV